MDENDHASSAVVEYRLQSEMRRDNQCGMQISHVAVAVSAMTALATVAASTGAQTAARPSGSCKAVSGHYVATQTTAGCQSTTGICFTGTVTGDKVLAGATSWTELDQAPSAGMPLTEPGTTVSYSGSLMFTTSSGTLVSRDLGVIDGARQAFTEMERPVGGTGSLVNASGIFFISGRMNSTLTAFDGSITGQLCGVL